jgi:hypothetical protein
MSDDPDPSEFRSSRFTDCQKTDGDHKPSQKRSAEPDREQKKDGQTDSVGLPG